MGAQVEVVVKQKPKKPKTLDEALDHLDCQLSSLSSNLEPDVFLHVLQLLWDLVTEVIN